MVCSIKSLLFVLFGTSPDFSKHSYCDGISYWFSSIGDVSLFEGTKLDSLTILSCFVTKTSLASLCPLSCRCSAYLRWPDRSWWCPSAATTFSRTSYSPRPPSRPTPRNGTRFVSLINDQLDATQCLGTRPVAPIRMIEFGTLSTVICVLQSMTSRTFAAP